MIKVGQAGQCGENGLLGKWTIRENRLYRITCQLIFIVASYREYNLLIGSQFADIINTAPTKRNVSRQKSIKHLHLSPLAKEPAGD